MLMSKKVLALTILGWTMSFNFLCAMEGGGSMEDGIYTEKFLALSLKDITFPAYSFLLDSASPHALAEHLNRLQKEDGLIFLNSLQICLNRSGKSIGDIRDKDGKNIIHAAAQNGYFDLIKLMIGQYPDLLYSLDNAKQTALMWASHKSKEKTVAVLLELAGDQAHDFAAMQAKDGSIALDCAAKVGSLNIVEQLIKIAGDDAATWIMTQRTAGRTSLHIAAFNGHCDVVAKLLEAVGDQNVLKVIYTKTEAGNSVYGSAGNCAKGNKGIQIIELLNTIISRLQADGVVTDGGLFGGFWNLLFCGSSGYERV